MDKHWENLLHNVLNPHFQIPSVDPTMPAEVKINSSVKWAF